MRVLSVSLLALCLSLPSFGTPIASYLDGINQPVSMILGQSFTVATAGASNNISFSFFSDEPPTVPSASGTGYLLDRLYTGSPNGLASATGLLGTAVASGGVWSFDPSLTLLGGVQYFFYSSTATVASGDNADSYAGGEAYRASNSFSSFQSFGSDANFVVNGTPVPELDLGKLGSVGVFFLVATALLASRPTRERLRGGR